MVRRKDGPCVFGHPRFSPDQVLGDARVQPVLEQALLQTLAAAGVGAAARRRMAMQIWSSSRAPAWRFERELRGLIGGVLDANQLRKAFRDRARRIVRQISPFLVPGAVLDVGCGDGLVGDAIARAGHPVTLVDILDYRDSGVALPYVPYRGGGRLPRAVPIAANALLLTVLHHSRRPLAVFEAVAQRTTERIIVIESVCGLGARMSAGSPLAGLPASAQRKYATFIDWLYNRVLHSGVQVPYNFASPSEWRKAFGERGWAVEHEVNLGADQPVVPEHHYLFALRPRALRPRARSATRRPTSGRQSAGRK